MVRWKTSCRTCSTRNKRSPSNGQNWSSDKHASEQLEADWELRNPEFDGREKTLVDEVQRLRQWESQLSTWQDELEERGRQIEQADRGDARVAEREKSQLGAMQAECIRQQAELESRQALITEAEVQLQCEKKSLLEQQAAFETERKQLAVDRHELSRQQQVVASEREQLQQQLQELEERQRVATIARPDETNEAERMELEKLHEMLEQERATLQADRAELERLEEQWLQQRDSLDARQRELESQHSALASEQAGCNRPNLPGRSRRQQPNCNGKSDWPSWLQGRPSWTPKARHCLLKQQLLRR